MHQVQLALDSPKSVPGTQKKHAFPHKSGTRPKDEHDLPQKLMPVPQKDDATNYRVLISA